MSYVGATQGMFVDLHAGLASGGGYGGNDTLSGIETVYGGNYADTFQAMNATSSFYGLGGNDLVRVRSAGGVFNGGQGTDTLDFGLSTQAATVNLSINWAGSGKTISNFENVNGGTFGDILTGSDAANVLNGGGGNDALAGLGGNDVLRGGAGREAMTGGLGSDIFDFDYTSDSAVGANRDRIPDFTGADWIDLAGIDANAAAGGNQAFAFVGQQAFSAAGQVRFYVDGNRTIVEVNTAGAGGSEMEIELAGALALAESDFIL